MAKRIISGIVALPILFFFVLKGGMVLSLGAFMLSLIGLHEFYRSFRSRDIKPMAALGYVYTVILYVVLYISNDISFLLLLMFTMVVAMLFTLVFSTKYTIEDIAITLLGFMYIPLAFSHIMLITKFELGSVVIWLVFIIAWGSDTFAYFVGRTFGKRKLIPSVSPNKTVAGSVGGVIASMILCGTFAYFFMPTYVVYAMVIGVVGAMISQIGDLVASKIKRINDIKDFGKLMPGHGGVLDRFDSILMTGPIVYYFIFFLTKY
ncbi:MAG: phosphatidate cytidylyltransferase [Acidaminobacteraceae bacterium]